LDAIRTESLTKHYSVGFWRPRPYLALDGLTMQVGQGEVFGFLGPTGAGKTTTLALLQRLRSLDEGRITVDGQDIADVTLTSLRQNMAVVFQDAGLFNRTIAENIRIGRPEATDADVEQVTSCKVLWKVPNAFHAVSPAIDHGTPIVLQEGPEISKSYRALAETLAEASSNSDGGPDLVYGQEGARKKALGRLSLSPIRAGQ